jgi:hypothetical protein
VVREEDDIDPDDVGIITVGPFADFAILPSVQVGADGAARGTVSAPVDDGRRPLRRRISPHHVDEPIRGHNPVRRRNQRSQQPPLSHPTQRRDTAIGGHLHGPQHLDPQPDRLTHRAPPCPANPGTRHDARSPAPATMTAARSNANDNSPRTNRPKLHICGPVARSPPAHPQDHSRAQPPVTRPRNFGYPQRNLPPRADAPMPAEARSPDVEPHAVMGI